MADPQDVQLRVLLVDDHTMFAESLARVLESEGISVVGLAHNGATGIHLAVQLKPDVVLIDYHMPDQNGVTTTAQIKRREPGIKVVMLTGSGNDSVLLAAIKAGCSGFLTKSRAASEVVDAVRAVAAGEVMLSPSLIARLLPELTGKSTPTSLTDRERDILALLAKGATNAAIALEMHLSINTIRNYVQSVLNKLGAHSKLEAVTMAVRDGIIDFPNGP